MTASIGSYRSCRTTSSASDQGKPSAAAVKLLAIKYARGGSGFVVSERLAGKYGMGRRE
jgi:hypothetical protein